MKYAVEQRLRLIDFLLDHYGKVNRVALEDFYGISTPQASSDFSAYKELAPDNMTYDAGAKCYVKTPIFKRYWA
jgi:hypothetical protein